MLLNHVGRFFVLFLLFFCIMECRPPRWKIDFGSAAQET